MQKELATQEIITSNPEDAWTLPGYFYFDKDIYQKELSEIFSNSWQYVCHGSRIKHKGDYFVRDIGDQSIVVIRDESDQIRAFHNVCQHRAHRLFEGSGKTGKRITCPYHAWCYQLDGKLHSAPGSEKSSRFPKDKITLQSVKVDSLCGFIFVHLNPKAISLNETFPGLEQEILELAPSAASRQMVSAENYDLEANWKNSIENYAECYHCPTRHPSLVNGALDIAQYKIDVRNGYHRHVTSDVGEHQGYSLSADATASRENFGSWLIWPSTVIEVYPGGNLTVFNHIPIAPEFTRQETEWYFAGDKPTAEEQEVIDFVDVVRKEDIPICESVQRGLHSMGYKQGKLIIDPDQSYVSEHAVHDFQVRVLKAIGGF